MSLSIWEYLRARTRDAVLAGFNDALDIAEQGDSNGSQHGAATQLVTRMKQQAERTLPEPSVGFEPSVGREPSVGPEPNHKPNVGREPSTNGHAAHAVSELLGAPAKPAADARPTGATKRPVGFDDELEQRLDAVATQNGEEKPSTGLPPGRLTERKRRGRPPKNRQD